MFKIKLYEPAPSWDAKRREEPEKVNARASKSQHGKNTRHPEGQRGPRRAGPCSIVTAHKLRSCFVPNVCNMQGRPD